MSWSKACSLIEKPENKTCSVNFLVEGNRLVFFSVLPQLGNVVHER